MFRRAAVLLLTVVLAFAGLTMGACPQAQCTMRQAKTMSCCQHTEGLSRPCCCPTAERISQPATPPAVDRPADTVAHVAWQVLPALPAAPAPTLVSAPLRIDPGTAPPGTLIAQHTALLL